MTLDPGPAYKEPTPAERKAERNADLNKRVEAIICQHARCMAGRVWMDLSAEVPEALLNDSLVETLYGADGSAAYRQIFNEDVAPYLAETMREFVMTLDEKVAEE